MVPAGLRRPAEAVDGAGRRLDRRVGASSAPCSERQSACGLADPHAYWERVRASRDRAAGADRGGRRARRPGSSATARRSPRSPAWRARNGCRRTRRRRAAPAEPAVLDRRRAVFDGDGAARRRRSGGPLSHRRRRHQRARARAGASARVYGKNSFRGQRARHSATATSTRRRDGYRLSETRPPAGALSAGQPVRRRLSAGRGALRRRSSAATC